MREVIGGERLWLDGLLSRKGVGRGVGTVVRRVEAAGADVSLWFGWLRLFLRPLRADCLCNSASLDLSNPYPILW
jgi:hypothetical protein